MTCDQCQDLILEALDLSLPADQQQALESHLAHCAPCASFREAQARLDAALFTALRPPVLPAGFRAAVLARLEAQSVRVDPQTREERRRALENEYRTRMADFKRVFFGPHGLRLLEPLGLGVAGLLVALLLPLVLSRLAPAGGWLAQWPASWANQAPWVAVACCWVAGTALGWRRDLLARLRV